MRDVWSKTLWAAFLCGALAVCLYPSTVRAEYTLSQIIRGQSADAGNLVRRYIRANEKLHGALVAWHLDEVPRASEFLARALKELNSTREDIEKARQTWKFLGVSIPEGENEAIRRAKETLQSYGIAVPATFGDVFAIIIGEARIAEERITNLLFEDSPKGQDTSQQVTNVVRRHLHLIQAVARLAAPRQ